MAEPRGSSRLVTTRWSLILAARDWASPDAREALSALCQVYWAPVHEFIRHTTGRSTDEARDLTQAFFAQVLEKHDFQNARRERGRFRNFLLTAVRHFLTHEAETGSAWKRGGRHVHVSLDAVLADDRRRLAEPASTETPETIYEERWAVAVLEQAMARLARHYVKRDRTRLFEQLQPHLTGGDPPSYGAAADALGMAESSVRAAVHRLRRQYGEALRVTIAETITEPAEIDAELKYLLSVLNRRQPVSSLQQI